MALNVALPDAAHIKVHHEQGGAGAADALAVSILGLRVRGQAQITVSRQGTGNALPRTEVVSHPIYHYTMLQPRFYKRNNGLGNGQ